MSERYTPKHATDADGNPKYNTKHFLSETVRMSDRTTRLVMIAANEGKASPRHLADIASDFRHVASRVQWVADDLAEKAREAKGEG